MRGALLTLLSVVLGASALVAAWATPSAAHEASHCSARTAPQRDGGTVPPPPWDRDCDSVRDQAAGGTDNCEPRFDDDFAMRNPDQTDSDGDGFGDRCDGDDDNDGVTDPNDNCRTVANPDQTPSEYPGIGAACVRDSDEDGVIDPLDNCVRDRNPGQVDTDRDGFGDVCDNDDDDDYVLDGVDNCPLVYNQDQADADGDGIGTACDERESSGGGGGSSGGGQPAADRTAPVIRLHVSGRHRLRALGAGLPVEVRCNEGCAISAQLTVNRATARRLRIGRKPAIVARGAAALGGRGTTYVFVRFKRGMTRRLARAPAVRAALSLIAADDARNVRRMTRAVTLRR